MLRTSRRLRIASLTLSSPPPPPPPSRSSLVVVFVFAASLRSDRLFSIKYFNIKSPIETIITWKRQFHENIPLKLYWHSEERCILCDFFKGLSVRASEPLCNDCVSLSTRLTLSLIVTIIRKLSCPYSPLPLCCVVLRCSVLYYISFCC